MSDPLPRDATFTTLRLSLEGDATALTPAGVVFELRLTGDPRARDLASVYSEARAAPPPGSAAHVGRRSGAREGTAARFTIPVTELAPPLDPKRADGTLGRFALTRDRVQRPKLTLPPHAVRLLAESLGRLLHDGEALWLEFVEPVGDLPLVAWEDVLRAATPAPILRLSPHVIPAVTARNEFVVLVCCSVSSKRALPSPNRLRRLLEALCPTGIDVTVHVFADAVAWPVFRAAARESAAGPGYGRFRLYDPATRDAPAAAVPAERAGPDDMRVREHPDVVREHPWVSWMSHALDGRAVDVVHWLADGAYPDDGILVASDPAVLPRPGASSADGAGRTFRFVPAPALLDFLTQVGAWGTVFSASASPRSLFGLRSTADRIARSRPGVAAAHDVDADPDAAALAGLYRFLRGGRAAGPAPGAGVLAYASPAWQGLTHHAAPAASSAPGTSAGLVLDAYRGVATAAQAIYDRAGPTPSWVAAAQRVAEESASRFVSEGAGDPAVERGVAEALGVLRRVFDEQAWPGAAYPPPPPGTRDAEEGPARA